MSAKQAMLVTPYDSRKNILTSTATLFRFPINRTICGSERKNVTSPHLSSSCSVAHKAARGFRNMKYFTGKGYLPFAQPPTWRARCCNSSDLSPGTCPARLNLPGTAVPADIVSRVTKARKTPHHDRVQHLGRKRKNVLLLKLFCWQKVRFPLRTSLLE